MKANANITGPLVKKLRQDNGDNQTEFWKSLGITQSGGCRYESGRNMPKPVRMLYVLVKQVGLTEEQKTALVKAGLLEPVQE